MLVLSRKAKEQIQIGANIVVKILEIHGNKVSIGISAPREVHIRRAELIELRPDLPLGLLSNVCGLDTVDANRLLSDLQHE